MRVAFVITQDRHTDTDVEVFLDTNEAILYAKKRAREFDRFGDLIEELTEAMRRAGWLYYGRYSVEGDHVRVLEREVRT